MPPRLSAATSRALTETRAPPGICSAIEKQSALRRTKVEYQKAADLRDSTQIGIEAERRNLAAHRKAQREIAIAERAISALVLRAPRDGIVVVRDHPWEGRKLQTGDTVWVGFPIAHASGLARCA